MRIGLLRRSSRLLKKPPLFEVHGSRLEEARDISVERRVAPSNLQPRTLNETGGFSAAS